MNSYYGEGQFFKEGHESPVGFLWVKDNRNGTADRIRIGLRDRSTKPVYPIGFRILPFSKNALFSTKIGFCVCNRCFDRNAKYQKPDVSIENKEEGKDKRGNEESKKDSNDYKNAVHLTLSFP